VIARNVIIPATALGLAALVAAGWGAERAAAAPAANAPRASVYNDYHPNLSDMMTMLIQPRHIKLGLAIRARNWTYATYEAGELRGVFRRVVASMPTYEGKDTAELVAMIGKPLEDMQAAVRSHDPAKADAAYADLTATCNMCHEAQGRTYIVIQAPAAAMFPDQNFSAR
jgi:hypothetical protein